jgi:hypothetical protein
MKTLTTVLVMTFCAVSAGATEAASIGNQGKLRPRRATVNGPSFKTPRCLACEGME